MVAAAFYNDIWRCIVHDVSIMWMVLVVLYACMMYEEVWFV
jgi:hypothetical protein